MYGNGVWMVNEPTNPKPLPTPKVVSMEFYAVNGEGHGGKNKKITSDAINGILKYPTLQRGMTVFVSSLRGKFPCSRSPVAVFLIVDLIWFTRVTTLMDNSIHDSTDLKILGQIAVP
jgi:hypothetical protein